MYRIGLDVGGTNTDAVLMDGQQVVAWGKSPTTVSVEDGIVRSMLEVLAHSGVPAADVAAVMIGTTHFTNALVERRRLTRVAAVRAALPANASVPIGAGWPDAMRDAMDLKTFMVHGGFNFDSRPIAPVDRAELDSVAGQIADAGIRAVAISAAFSPLAPQGEAEVADALRQWLPDAVFSLSSEVGRLGLLERENATILNAALSELAQATFAGFERSLQTAGLSCPLFISQNDGTLMSADFAARYPVRTLSSGPTNSMRGAAFLTGIDRAVVLDLGGTTTDAGALIGGFPREAPSDLSIAGVRTNFRMPDVMSVGLGGGSVVRFGSGPVEVGPTSVGYEITTKALVFGGDVLTATDLAVRAGLARIGDPERVAVISDEQAEAALTKWHAQLDDLIAKMRGTAEHLPVILVGGGSILVDPGRLTEAAACIAPDFYQVANAVGASVPQVSGEIDRVVSLAVGRDAVLEECRREAVDLALRAGASLETVEIHDEEVTTLNLLGADMARVRIRAIGAVPLDDVTRIKAS